MCPCLEERVMDGVFRVDLWLFLFGKVDMNEGCKWLPIPVRRKKSFSLFKIMKYYVFVDCVQVYHVCDITIIMWSRDSWALLQCSKYVNNIRIIEILIFVLSHMIEENHEKILKLSQVFIMSREKCTHRKNRTYNND